MRARVFAPENRRWWTLGALAFALFMIMLDNTVVNVALPSIQRDLGIGLSELEWTVNAYALTFAVLMLTGGKLADFLGRRRVFLVGLAIFTLSSLVCGLAQSQEVLVGARFVQGVGGALTSGVILGIIVTMFTDAREQGRAIGVYSFVASAGASIGLLAGGLLTQGIDWHWIFFVNIPIGIATAVLALRLVDKDEGIGLDRGADVLGAALVTVALMLGVYTILEAGDYGWGSLRTLGFGGIALALLAAFVARQARTPNPLVPLRMFRSRNVTGANVVQMLMVAGLFGMFFLGVLYLQGILGYDAIETGLAFLPVSVLIGVLSLWLSPRLNERFGARATLLAGLVLLVAALGLFARAPLDAGYVVDLLATRYQVKID
jgi:EmrB/QacA subfamily drug resistance transporter